MSYKTVFAVIALVILAVIVPLLLPMFGDRQPPRSAENLPWQVEALPGGGSRVFGLALDASTLADAGARFGPGMEVAVVAAPNEAGSIEAYFDNITLGFVAGKLILTAEADAAAIEGMRRRALKYEFMESTTRKYMLHPDDLAAAMARPIRAIAFIPAARLDEQTVLARFGPPAERIRSGENIEHFLYPALGLDLRLDAKGKEVLQYVAPRHFSRLREPLLAPPPPTASG